MHSIFVHIRITVLRNATLELLKPSETHSMLFNIIANHFHSIATMLCICLSHSVYSQTLRCRFLHACHVLGDGAASSGAAGGLPQGRQQPGTDAQILKKVWLEKRFQLQSQQPLSPHPSTSSPMT
eukprot:626337-Amphidinium_carterae.1